MYQLFTNTMEIDTQCCVCSKLEGFKLSCSHTLCAKCASDKINENQIISCPKCGIICQDDIKTLFDTYMSVPINKLFVDHDFIQDDVLWTYSGFRENKWLYTREQCITIENAYKNFLDLNDDESSNSSVDESNDISEFNLSVTINNNTTTYILNFDNMDQHPLNDSTKKRNLDRFLLCSYDDITNNNIIGVAGKKF